MDPIGDLAAMCVGADERRGAALRLRMAQLGLPASDEPGRDVAGFERHCRASEQVGIGARAHIAQRVLPALDAAMQHGPQVGDGVVIDGEVVRQLRQLAFGAARLAERIGVDDGQEG